MMDEQSNLGRFKKVWMAVIFGLLSLILSPYGIKAVIVGVTIDIPWTLFLPIIISMAFGWRYGIIAGLSGAALFPFLLWENNGYANIGTALIFLSFYVLVGLASNIKFWPSFRYLPIRLAIAISLGIAMFGVYDIFIFNRLLSHNPTFWTDNTVGSLPIDLLYTFVIKDGFNLVILTLITDTLLRIPIIRRHLGIPTAIKMVANTKIFAITLVSAVLVWLTFLGLDTLLFQNEQLFSDGHVELALVVILLSGFLASRMLFYYSESELASKVQLQESESLYRLLTENSTDLIARHDASGNFLYVSPACNALLGYFSDDLIGHKFTDFVHPDDILALEPMLSKSSNQFDFSSSEFRFLCKSGKYIWLETLSHFIFSKTTGELLEIHTSSRDISARKLMDFELMESEAKFKALYDNANDAIFILQDGKFSDCNPITLKFFGCSHDEILGKTPAFFSPQFQPDGRLSEEKALSLIALATEGFPQQFEWQHTRLDGSVFDADVFLNRLVVNDNLLLQAIVRDITQRKQAEELLKESENRYKSITDGLTDYLYTVIVKDGKAVETIHSEACLAITGYSSKELEADYYLWYNMILEEDKAVVSEKFKSILKGEMTAPFEHRIVCKDGSIRWLSDTVILRFDSSGKLVSYDGVIKDITHRKQAEEKLRESERVLRESQAVGHIGSYIIDLKTGVWESTAQIENIFGIDHTYPHTFEGLGRIIHPDSRDDFWAYHQEVMEQRKRFEYEYQIIRIDNGEPRWLQGTGELEYDSNHNPIKMLGVIQDITERKHAEDALKSLATNYANLSGKAFFNAVSLHIAKAMKLDFVFVGELAENCKSVNVLGGSAHYMPMGEMNYELHDTPCSNVMGKQMCFYKSGIQGMFPKDQLLSDMGVESYVGAPLFGKNHEPLGILVALHSKPMDETDTLSNYFNFFIDRLSAEMQRLKAEKQLRESEAKLSALFGSMTEMVVLHEVVFNDKEEAINYRITDCNTAFTNITGIKKEDAIGKLATEVYQTEVPPYLSEFTQVGITGKSYEYTTFFAPMEKYFMISVVSPDKNTFATITTDITMMRQVQDAISAKNKELESYLYITSHDLRSPLVNIQGFSQRLQKHTNAINAIISKGEFVSEERGDLEKIINEGIPKSLDFIFTNVTKMDTLINGLLQISRTGRVKMTIQKIDMLQLFHTILGALNFQISEARAIVSLENIVDCYGDENLLDQLFSNLIGNAIKYRDSKRLLKLKITSVQKFNRVIYQIEDNGIGINAKHLEKIWDVFYRVDPTIAATGEGIGLSLAKQIVNKHQGRIWVESEEGKGTIFFVELQKKIFIE